MEMKCAKLLQLTLLVSLIASSTSAENFQPKKCCPSGQLVKLDNLTCVENTEIRSSQLIGGILTEGIENWPACDEIKFSIIENSTETLLNSCIDLTETRQVAMFHCDSDESTALSNGKLLAVYHVNRCCPVDTLYNFESRSCVAATNQSIPSADDDISIVLESFHLPECATNESLVEYHSRTHKIQHEKGLLFVNDRRIDRPFCTAYTTDGDSIAKVCESVDICDRLPCIRKCCKERQFFDTTAEERPKCKDYDVDLIKPQFHSFTMGDDLLGDRPPSMSITGKLNKLIGNSNRALCASKSEEKNKKTYQIHAVINLNWNHFLSVNIKHLV